MIKTIRSRLGIKLFLSHLLVILVGVVVIAIATRFSVPGAFNRHLGMGRSTGMGMMQGNDPARIPAVTLFQDFQASFNEALILALLAASVVAIPISILLSRRVVAPVRAMTKASQRVAEGHYQERVQLSGEDELGQLAQSFNQMAQKLEQVESMRRQLIGDISHELRTPLTAIKGSMEGLMDGVLPASSSTYQQIHNEAGRLERLVDDLQELSRVEAGSYQLEISPVSLPGMVESVFKRLEGPARQKGVLLASELTAGMPKVMADPDRLIQVLTNLVGNAIQYSTEGGKVTISSRSTEKDVQVSVSDTGIGIPAEHLPHLFQRFYRVDKSRSRQAGGGSGIGLTIARHLVEAQGGSIRVESEGQGKGSSFTFSLPAAP
jgi:signal transduction histidine kinase